MVLDIGPGDDPASETGDIVLGDIDATDLIVRADRDILDTAEDAVAPGAEVLTISGVGEYRAGRTISLGQRQHQLGAVRVDASALNAELDDIDALVLGELRIGSRDAMGEGDIAATPEGAGLLDVTAGGAITDTADRTIVVAGDARFTVLDTAAIALDNLADGFRHDFAGSVDAFRAETEEASASPPPAVVLDPPDPATVLLATAVTLVDVNDIQLGTVAADTLSVAAGGTINDTPDEAITVAGTATLSAGDADAPYDIVLDNLDTHDFMGRLNASGEDIAILDIGGLTLGEIAADAGRNDANWGALDGDGSDVDQVVVLRSSGASSSSGSSGGRSSALQTSSKRSSGAVELASGRSSGALSSDSEKGSDGSAALSGLASKASGGGSSGSDSSGRRTSSAGGRSAVSPRSRSGGSVGRLSR
ncbi:MAG: hypothetical protein AAFU70_10720, partial [Planctomycetota bacterium]